MAHINYFDQIYQAALQQDERLLPPKGTYAIDEFKQGHPNLSAAAQLALEGKFDAVRWLTEQGAHINYAAYGAAIGGHVDFANKLIQQGADISCVAEGAAFGGDIDFANELLQRGANITRVARGAAQGGHVEFANELYHKGANINSVVAGAIIGGHGDNVKERIRILKEITPGTINYYNRIAEAFAEAGDFVSANKLIEKSIRITRVAEGAARGGHVEYVNELIERGAHIEEVAILAAEGGHIDFANELIDRGAPVSWVAQGAAQGGHVDLANALIERGARISCVASGAADGKHVSTEQQQLYFLSRFEHQTTRDQLVDKLSRLTFNAITIEPAIRKRADRMAKLRFNFSYPYPLALTSSSVSQLRSDDAAETNSTTRTNSGALVMLAASACFQNPYPLSKDENANDIQITLPPELWHRIFEFVFECDLSQKDLQQLGFLTGRLILLNQVSDCQQDDALKKEILERTNVSELRDLVSSKIECDDNDAASTSITQQRQTIFSTARGFVAESMPIAPVLTLFGSFHDFVSSKTERDDNDAASTSIAQQQQTIFSSWHKRLEQDDSDAANCGARVTPD